MSDKVVHLSNFKRVHEQREQFSSFIKADFGIRDAAGALGAQGTTVAQIAHILLWHGVRAAHLIGATSEELQDLVAELSEDFSDDSAHGYFWLADWIASGGSSAGVDNRYLPPEEES